MLGIGHCGHGDGEEGADSVLEDLVNEIVRRERKRENHG